MSLFLVQMSFLLPLPQRLDWNAFNWVFRMTVYCTVPITASERSALLQWPSPLVSLLCGFTLELRVHAYTEGMLITVKPLSEEILSDNASFDIWTRNWYLYVEALCWFSCWAVLLTLSQPTRTLSKKRGEKTCSTLKSVMPLQFIL